MTQPMRRDTGIRLLAGATTIALYLMMAITALAVILCALVLSGRGSVSVDSSLEPPYTIGLRDDRSLTVGPAGRVTTYTNFDVGEESRYFDSAPTVRARVQLDRKDRDSRMVGVVAVVMLLALGWAGLIALRQVVRSARGGDPFDPHNVRRFRWLAAIVVVGRLVLEIGERVLTRTLDADVAVNVSLTRLSWAPVVGVALGMLALSEIFRTGSELRLFERETV